MRQQEMKTKKTENMMPAMMANSRNQKPAPTKTPNKMTTASKPSHEEIAKKAYHYYMERGGMHGCDRDDWYRAEQELMRKYR